MFLFFGRDVYGAHPLLTEDTATQGKGGWQRLSPVSGRFFAAVAAYLDAERPPGAGTDRVFVVLKGPRRGQPLSATGMEEILAAARAMCHRRIPVIQPAGIGCRTTGVDLRAVCVR